MNEKTAESAERRSRGPTECRPSGPDAVASLVDSGSFPCERLVNVKRTCANEEASLLLLMGGAETTTTTQTVGSSCSCDKLAAFHTERTTMTGEYFHPGNIRYTVYIKKKILLLFNYDATCQPFIEKY